VSSTPVRLLLVASALLAVAGIVAAYFFYDVATQRIDGFLFGEGDTFQTDNAMRTLTAGGLFGMGPGAGTRKFGLPEPQTDYIFSVIGEEFGLIACLAIAILYLTIVARVLVKLLDEDSPFAILAGSGLVLMFGLQALINMAVNVQIAPSKGMTLPFISYGGSSALRLRLENDSSPEARSYFVRLVNPDGTAGFLVVPQDWIETQVQQVPFGPLLIEPSSKSSRT